MDIEETELRYASRRERLLAITIFSLVLVSFFLHLVAFSDVFWKDIEDQKNKTEIPRIESNNHLLVINMTIHSKKKLTDIFDVNLLPMFCIMAHLIWTIVPTVVLDRCCILNCKSIWRISFKLFICTLPLLLCSELSIILISYMYSLTNEPLMITIKWLIFIATVSISFWTGTLSDQDKWRGIHGGQIAPEHQSPLYLYGA